MQLPAFFGHKRSINLLPRDAFESSTTGVVLEWALAFGKWAVILTQLVVMLAFLWRFTLDRQMTDSQNATAKDVAIIKSYEQIERDFTLAQKRVVAAQSTIDSQTKVAAALDAVAAVTPAGIWYDHLTATPQSLSLTAYAASLGSFGQFLTAIQNNPLFSAVSIVQIQDGGAKGAQMQFDINLTMGAAKRT